MAVTDSIDWCQNLIKILKNDFDNKKSDLNQKGDVFNVYFKKISFLQPWWQQLGSA